MENLTPESIRILQAMHDSLTRAIEATCAVLDRQSDENIALDDGPIDLGFSEITAAQ